MKVSEPEFEFGIHHFLTTLSLSVTMKYLQFGIFVKIESDNMKDFVQSLTLSICLINN